MSRPRAPDEKVRVLKLLEIQRNAMLMYTSCGWFFDDISGIEPVQVMRYAGRAMQLAADFGESGLEEQFLAILRDARGNTEEYPDGAAVYNRLVSPPYSIRSVQGRITSFSPSTGKRAGRTLPVNRRSVNAPIRAGKKSPWQNAPGIRHYS